MAERFETGPAYTRFDRMLADVRPEVVHVLTPPASHSELAGRALDAGAHVLVEKPIAPTWDEYARMREGARAHRRLLCEDYNTRFSSAALGATSAWRSGRLGDVVSVDVAYGGVMPAGSAYDDRDVPHFAHALPGGPLQNFATHPLSLALPYLGPGVEIVPVWRSRDELRVGLAGPEAYGTVTVSGRAMPPHLMMTVRGTSGWLEADILTGRLHVGSGGSAGGETLRQGLAGLRCASTLAARKLAGRQETYQGLGTLIDSVHHAAVGDAPPPVALHEMDEVNAAMRAIFEDAGVCA
jgi:predicted dehydrogenase